MDFHCFRENRFQSNGWHPILLLDFHRLTEWMVGWLESVVQLKVKSLSCHKHFNMNRKLIRAVRHFDCSNLWKGGCFYYAFFTLIGINFHYLFFFFAVGNGFFFVNWMVLFLFTDGNINISTWFSWWNMPLQTKHASLTTQFQQFISLWNNFLTQWSGEIQWTNTISQPTFMFSFKCLWHCLQFYPIENISFVFPTGTFSFSTIGSFSEVLVSISWL